MTNIQLLYQLDQCLDWIIDNQFTRIALQLKHEDLKHSVDIIRYLNDGFKDRPHSNNREALDLYVTKTNTCCVDLLVTQHVTNLDAIIHFGRVCLSRPELENQVTRLPILFVFSHPMSSDQEKLTATTNEIITHIKSIKKSDNSKRIFVAYDTDLIDCANRLRDHLQRHGLAESVIVAKLNNLSSSWYTTPNNEPYFIKYEGPKENVFGHYILEHNVESYDCAVYLGIRNSIHLTLNGPTKQYRIKVLEDTVNLEAINVCRVLNRRMALVGRLKEEEELNVGVILTNPLPNIVKVCTNLEDYAKSRRHRLYYISMIQTIDECKIGNFDLCDAFVVINSCTCSTILESLVFNRPIIAEHEFKLACGIEAEYGRVLWPGSSSHLSADDMINKRKVSDVSLALIHTRNELLERCSQARTNKWSGMEYKASVGSDGGDDLEENLGVIEGLHGIASSYASEPLNKSNPCQSDHDNVEERTISCTGPSSHTMVCTSRGSDNDDNKG